MLSSLAKRLAALTSPAKFAFGNHSCRSSTTGMLSGFGGILEHDVSEAVARLKMPQRANKQGEFNSFISPSTKARADFRATRRVRKLLPSKRPLTLCRSSSVQALAASL